MALPQPARQPYIGSPFRRGRPALGRQRLRVVILYTHPLLGEGLARLLALEQGIAVTCAPARDAEIVMHALKGRPDAVVFEWNDVVSQVDLPTAVPGAVLIDATMDASRGPMVVTDAGSDDVLSTLRDMRGTPRRKIADTPPRAPTASSPT